MGDLDAVENELFKQGDGKIEPKSITDSYVRDLEDTNCTSCKELLKYIDGNKVFERPPNANRAIVEASLTLTNKLFTACEAKASPWTSQKECFEALVRFTCDVHQDIFSDSFGSAMDFIDVVRKHSKQ
eukprot:5064142-Pyramimonas_sp.AAC.1